MKAKIETQIEISGTPQQAWNVLMDVEKYPQWNPFVKSLTGTLEVGRKIQIKLPGMSFKPIVQEMIENKKFSWLGKLGIKGVFDGYHQFELIDQGTSTLFIHKEEFNGWLVKWFMKNKAEETKRGFEEMNEALKRRVENAAAS